MDAVIIGLLIGVLVVCVGIAVCVAAIGFVLLDRTKTLPHISSQVDLIESLVVGGQMPMGGHAEGVFRSIDGKHTAGSLDELIDKMRSDPPDFPDGMNPLDNLFDGNIDDDDEEDDEEDWRKKKGK
jgi:hypothetical protein